MPLCEEILFLLSKQAHFPYSSCWQWKREIHSRCMEWGGGLFLSTMWVKNKTERLRESEQKDCGGWVDSRTHKQNCFRPHGLSPRESIFKPSAPCWAMRPNRKGGWQTDGREGGLWDAVLEKRILIGGRNKNERTRRNSLPRPEAIWHAAVCKTWLLLR